jgi:hypothetical protein
LRTYVVEEYLDKKKAAYDLSAWSDYTPSVFFIYFRIRLHKKMDMIVGFLHAVLWNLVALGHDLGLDKLKWHI